MPSCLNFLAIQHYSQESDALTEIGSAISPWLSFARLRAVYRLHRKIVAITLVQGYFLRDGNFVVG